jgi:hypothetical protein
MQPLAQWKPQVPVPQRQAQAQAQLMAGPELRPVQPSARLPP